MKRSRILMSSILVFLAGSHGSYAQWVPTNGPTGGTVFSLVTSGLGVLAGTDSGVFLSTNNGEKWVQLGLNNESVFTLAATNSIIYAGTERSGVYTSGDGGLTWTQTYLSTQRVLSLAASNSAIFASAYNEGLYRSTDDGLTWVYLMGGVGGGQLAATDSAVFTGGCLCEWNCVGSVAVSRDNGQTWTSSLKGCVSSVTVNALDVFVAVTHNYEGGCFGATVYHSSNNGSSWIPVSSIDRCVNNIEANGGPVLFAAAGNIVYRSTDNGQSWNSWNDGLPSNSMVRSFCVKEAYVFGGTAQHGVWRRPLSDLVGIDPPDDHTPSVYSLHQNYPNPFNPSTNIEFKIRDYGFVSLRVYDVLGREVATLVNEVKQTGSYEVTWDASGMATGVYLYRLDAGAFTATKKLILMR